MRTAATRQHVGLDATRTLIPLRHKTWAQLIGSGTRFQFRASDIRGWDLALVHHKEMRHAFNAQTLVEMWLETGDQEPPIYCMGKFIQQQSSSSCIVRIVEIDSENLNRLQEILYEASRPLDTAA